MFEKIFSKGAYLVLIVATFPFGLIFGQVGIQMKDLLCGCEHCKTVDPGVPLHIGYHMMKCHSWREGMQETMEMMRKTEKPKVKIEKRPETIPAEIEENFSEEINDNVDNPNTDYTWKETDSHGWAYATTNQINFFTDQWLYLEELGWVWTMASNKHFMYTYDYGWIYTMIYQNIRVLYWYDRRIWMLPRDFTQKK